MGLTATDITDILKEQYPEGLDEEIIMKNHKLLPMMKRRRDFAGRYLHVPIQFGKPQGRSHSFSNAQTNEYASKFDAFDVTRVNDYGVAELDGEVVDAGAIGSNTEIFIDHMKCETDGALSSLGDNLAKEAYRGTGGARGQVGTYTATESTFILKDVEDVVFFEVGMELQADTVDGGGTVHAGTATITAINRNNGTITTDSAFDTQITGFAADDYLFVQGDYDSAAAGVAAWVPSSDPGATAFFGVDRSIDVERLGGIRYDGSNDSMETVWIEAEARCARSQAKITHYFANPQNIAELKSTLEGRKRIIDVETNYDGISFRELAIMDGQTGEIPLVSDPDCPKDVAYGLDMTKWTWATMGDAPRVTNADGLQFERKASADAYELRVVARHNFYTPKPGGHVRVTLPSAA